MNLELPAKHWSRSPKGDCGTLGIGSLSDLFSPGNDSGSCLGMGGTGWEVRIPSSLVPWLCEDSLYSLNFIFL